MSDRMQLLEDALASVGKYTKFGPDWRPGLVDLFVYDIMINMHESDYENGSTVPDYIWRKTPDEVMEHLITNTSIIFDLEYGWEVLDEEIREFLLTNDFIVSVDDVSDEEYQTNLEKEIK